MTIQETAQIMDILTVAYPQFYSGRNAPDPQKALSLWAGMFADDDVIIVAAAVKALIATDTGNFPPSIGAVKARIRQITTPQEMTEGEAWALVLRAISRSAYNAREEFDKLPKLLQSVVGSPNQLRDWAMMDSDTVQSVVASNVQRSYKARAAANRDYAALPADVKALVDSMADKLALKEETQCTKAMTSRNA